MRLGDLVFKCEAARIKILFWEREFEFSNVNLKKRNGNLKNGWRKSERESGILKYGLRKWKMDRES